MTPADVRATYRDKLDDAAHGELETGSRGAGLGLLTVARHATSPLEYVLEPEPGAGGTLSRFQLCARVDAGSAQRSAA